MLSNYQLIIIIVPRYNYDNNFLTIPATRSSYFKTTIFENILFYHITQKYNNVLELLYSNYSHFH